MKNAKAQLGKMEKQLKQWGAKLDQLAAKADEAGAEMKADYRQRIDDLKTKHQAAQAKLDDLKTAGGVKWAILKTGVDSAWKELDLAFTKLSN